MNQNLSDAIIHGALAAGAVFLVSIAVLRTALVAIRGEISKNKPAADCGIPHGDDTAGQLKDIRDILAVMRDFTARQSAETQRWKDGYDFRILKSFLLRVISAVDEIEEQIWILKKRNAAAETIAELEFARDKLIGDLDGEGLVRNEPPVGVKIDPSTTRLVIKGVDETGDATLANVISRSLGAEYVLWLADGHEKTIRPGQVKIFKLTHP